MPDIIKTNVDNSLTGWKPVCIKPNCNPGGNGIPRSTNQTINNANPSKDGASMQFSLSGPTDTNALWVYDAGANDAATQLDSNFWVYLGPNWNLAGQFEVDMFIFSTTDNQNYMFGHQYNFVKGFWQIWDQLHNSWKDTTVTAAPAIGGWTHIQQSCHRVVGQQKLYFDYIIVNGVQFFFNANYPSGPLPQGWSSNTGIQFQMNTKADTGSSSVQMNVDEVNFSCTTPVILPPPPPNTDIHKRDIEDSLTGWKPVCIQPNCNPGGDGVPTATAQTINNATPSRDGASMQLSLTAPASVNGTNALWVYLAGSDDAATQLTSDFWIYLSANYGLASVIEIDMFNFDKTDGVQYTFGMRYNFTRGLWQVLDQMHGTWQDTAITQGLSFGTWHHIKQLVHRLKGNPNLFYDTITIDDVVNYFGVQLPSGPLPSTYASTTGIQFQINALPAGTGGQPITANIDLVNFDAVIATPVIQPPITPMPSVPSGVPLSPGAPGSNLVKVGSFASGPTRPSTLGALRGPIVDPSTGMPTESFIRYVRTVEAKTSASLDLTGVLNPVGLDLSRNYVNKNVDHIYDGDTYKRTTANEKVGGGRGYNALDANNRLVGSFHNNPVNVSAVPTAAFTISNDGVSTVLSIVSHSNQFGTGQVAYNSGSVDPGAFGTWYVYFDDPQFLGGSVIYQASTDPVVAGAGDGRMLVGIITTVGGSGKTGGGNTGGTTPGGKGGRGYDQL